MPGAGLDAAGSITVEIQTATLDRNVIGRQPISNALRIDCAANFGVAAITNTSARSLQLYDLGVDVGSEIS